MKYFTLLILVMLSTIAAGQQLWKQVAGTKGFNPIHLTSYYDKILFTTRDSSSNSSRLSTCNKKNEITALADDSGWNEGRFSTDFEESNPFVIVGQNIYYAGLSGTDPLVKLYKWDENSKRSILLDINQNKNPQPRCMQLLNGKIYMSMDSVHSNYLWEYDIAGEAGRRLADISAVYPTGFITDIVILNNKVCLKVITIDMVSHLMEYDPANGSLTTVPASTSFLSISSRFLVYNNRLYFVSVIDNISKREEICMYDGINPIKQLTSFLNVSINPDPGMGALDNKLYFQCRETKGERIWSYDLETRITERVAPLQNLAEYNDDKLFTVYKNKLILIAYTAAAKMALYRFDGVGTVDIVDSTHNGFAELVVVGDKLYYTAFNDSNIRAMYSYTTNEIILPDSVELSLYPNPTTGAVTFAFRLAEEQAMSFIVTDIAGKTVYRNALTNYKAGVNSINFDAGHFSSGVYYCRLAGETNTVLKGVKLLKK